MPRAKKQIAPEVQEALKVTGIQSYDMVVKNRAEISLTDYNPRYIDKHARSKLKTKIASGGLIESFVVNKRTGNLVGGHQRIGILDELEGNQKYDLEVAEIDVDLRTEKELNIFLNNKEAQGEYNFDSLMSLSNDIGFTGLEAGGFDFATLQSAFGDIPKDKLDKLKQQSKVDSVDEHIPSIFLPQFDAAAEEAQKVAEIQKIKESYKKGHSKKVQETEMEFYLVVIFDNAEQKDAFFQAIGNESGDRHFDGMALARKQGFETSETQYEDDLLNGNEGDED